MKKKVNPIYPTTFHSFASGVDLDNKTINEFLKSIKKKTEELEPGKFTIKATGNTCVIGLKYTDTEQYIVAKNYSEDEIWLDE